MKSFFSEEVKDVFKKIFVEDPERACIEDLEETAINKKGHAVHPNFINTNTDEIMVDPHILDLIQNEFGNIKFEIIESITKFKLDQNYSLYYLMVQK